MEESPLRTFIELIDFDQNIVTLQNKLNAVQEQLYALQDKEKELETIVVNAKQRVHDAQKIVDEHELQMRELEQQEKAKKKKIEESDDARVYKSLKNELAAIHEKQNSLETDLIAVWNTLETSKRELVQKQEQCVQEKDTLAKAMDEKSVEVNNLAASIDEQTTLRPGKEEMVPQEWLEKYATMRARVTDPVVSIINDSCSACYHQVTQQHLVLLRRNKLLQCKGCYRFLFVPSKETDESSKTESETES